MSPAMKSITLTKYEIELFLSFLSAIPGYLDKQLGDMSKRTLQIDDRDHSFVLQRAQGELSRTRCKARRRRLEKLVDRLTG